jgi:hypothetical protein
MPDKEKVNWNVAIQVAGGPAISTNGSSELVVYSKARLIIANTKEATVKLGDGADVKLVAIVPGKPHDKLTYKLGGNDIKLDGPQVMIGSGAVSFVAGVFPDLKFTNNSGAEAAIDVLVGRA